MRWLKWGGAVFGLAVLALLAANLVDESLTPEAAAYYGSREIPVEARPGGFALVAGFDAPAGQDPRAYGQVKLATKGGIAPRNLGAPLALKGSHLLMCTPETDDCPGLLTANPMWIEELVLDNAVLLARYHELQAEPDLAESGAGPAIDVPVYGFGTILQVQRVLLSQLALQARQGRVPEVLDRLVEDGRFYRRWMSQSRMLVGKMVAARGITRDLLLASQLVRHADALSAHDLARLRELAAPLDPASMELTTTTHVEALFLMNMIDRVRTSRSEAFALMDRGLPAELQRFLLRNATLNAAYPLYAAWTRLDGRDAASVVAEANRLAEAQRAALRPGIHWLRNAPGWWFLEDNLPQFGAYNLRLRDADAIAHLVRAQVEVRAAAVTPDNVASFLVTSPPEWRNPHADAPMQWDPQARTLWFKPASERIARDAIGGRKDRVAISPWPSSR
jgi:hypothetical protein